MVSAMTENAIEICTHLCTKLHDKVEGKGDELINNVIHTLNKAEQESLCKNNDNWSLLSTQMKNSQTALAAANGTTIKNTKILTSQLDKAEARIRTLNKSLAVQQVTIKNMSDTILDNENKLTELRNPDSLAYKTIVNDKAKELIEKALMLHLNESSDDNKTLQSFLNKCNNIGEETTFQVQHRVEEACIIMQDKCNKLTKSYKVNRCESE